MLSMPRSFCTTELQKTENSMPHIPLPVLKECLSDMFYSRCCLADWNCMGNISLEEAFLFGGRQVKEKWNIIPLCHRHHSVGVWMESGLLNKEKNEWVALNRASEDELDRYSKVQNLRAKREYLNEKYGKEWNIHKL